ncbi:dipeptidase 1-like isoform X2 [Rhodnius prolixus]|uniref:dipeptidase 1-like isoform X2 n=1 Tax=Rhodnius prolixus TaxID=13249 RepID=UPI003D18D662
MRRLLDLHDDDIIDQRLQTHRLLGLHDDDDSPHVLARPTMQTYREYRSTDRNVADTSFVTCPRETLANAGKRRSLPPPAQTPSQPYQSQQTVYRPYSDDQKILIHHATHHYHHPTADYHAHPDHLRYYGESCCCEGQWGPGTYLHGGTSPSDVYPSPSHGLAPGSIPGLPSRPARRRRPSDSEEDIISCAPSSEDYRCSCDHIPNGNYRHLQEEESAQFPPDVTQNKQEVTFYPKPPASTTASTSTTSGSCMPGFRLRVRQRWMVLIALVLAAAAGVGLPIALKIQAGASFEERLEIASRLLQEVPLIDGHNDLPWNIRKFVHNRLNEFRFGEDLRGVPPWSLSAWSHTDLQRLRAGQVSAQFWAAYVPCESQFKDAVQLTLEQIDVIRRLTEKYSPPLTFCTSAQEITEAHEKNHLCSLIGVEGGHSLANSLPVLRILYTLGVRYLTLTSTCNTQWADSSLVDVPGRKPEHGGLTNFGKIIVKEMNRLGMLVDLSHVSVRTMKAALEVSKAPVIFSHSSARALCNSTRNVPDHILAKLGLNGGLVMVNFYSQFLTCKDTATIADAAAHINHIRGIAGVDSVGLGAGYDGINFTPKGLEDVSMYPALFAELISTGQWTSDELKKLAGLNLLRVLRAVEKVRDDMAKSGVEPYEDTIAPKYLKGRSNCTSQEPF